MNSRRIMCFLVFAAVILLGFQAVIAADPPRARGRSPQLLVRNISAGQDIRDHEWGVVKIEVGVEERRAPYSTKTKLKRSPLRIKVDDKEVECSVIDSSTGYEGKKAYTYRTVAIRLGPQPGPKVISILYNGLVRRIPVNYDPSGQLAFGNLYDHQAIFGTGPVTVRWLGSYLARESITARINGEAAPAEIVVPPETPELVEGRISPGEKLKPGANTVTVEAVDIKGAKREMQIVLLYYPDNRIPVGDSFVLNLGVQDPKDGPFYDSVVQGESLVKKHEFSLRPGPEKIGSHIVMPAGLTALAWFEATGPGESVIVTREKQYLTDEPREVRTARVVVYTAPRPLDVLEAGGHRLDHYVARDLFACALPADWPRVENPEADWKIYGVAASEPEGEGKPGPRISIEFHGIDSLIGQRTAEEYLGALMNARPAEETPRITDRMRKALQEFLRTGDSGETPLVDRVRNTYKELIHPSLSGQAPVTATRAIEAKVAGRQARGVEREVPVISGRTSIFTTKITFAERLLVVPIDAGFYVLSFSVPAVDEAKYQALFEAVIGSFQSLK